MQYSAVFGGFPSQCCSYTSGELWSSVLHREQNIHANNMSKTFEISTHNSLKEKEYSTFPTKALRQHFPLQFFPVVLTVVLKSEISKRWEVFRFIFAAAGLQTSNVFCILHTQKRTTCNKPAADL